MKQSEFDARIVIDRKLQEAGWDIEDKSQVSTYGGDVAGGQDYTLKDRRGRVLAFIEAKKPDIEPYSAKGQAQKDAEAHNAEFIFLSNGEKVLFWDYKGGSDARPVSGFFTQKDLESRLAARERIVPLSSILWKETESIIDRKYQTNAVKTFEAELEQGKRKALLEMATGTGKTRVAIAIVKRLILSGRVKRVLFLVDRSELANQAESAFKQLLSDHSAYILRSGAKKQEKEITISTLQTMVNTYAEFSPAYFDLVISDECHRSIYGQWQVCLSRFDAIQLGLTATPSPQIDKNTYEFFDCTYLKPTYTYTLQDGIKEGYLSSYNIYKALTGIVIRGLKYESDDYDVFDLERKVIVPATNKAWVQEFRQKAGDNPGKTIVFAVTKRHAARLAMLLNEAYPEHQGKMAEVITSDTIFADRVIRRFKTEKYPQIAVSVGMLDTGFDCPEVVNIVMMRPTASVVLYLQMRGRGSRICDRIKKKAFIVWDFVGNSDFFKDKSYDPRGLAAILFSGFGHAEHRRMPTGTHEPIELPNVQDQIESRAVIQVGTNGELVDRKEYQDVFVMTVKKLLKDHPILKKIKDNEKVGEKEIERLAVELNQPKYFFNEENLQQVYDQRFATLVEFIRYAIGTYKFPNPEELINNAFESYVTQKNYTQEQARFLRVLANRFIVNQVQLTMEDFDKPAIRSIGGIAKAKALFDGELKKIIEELNTLVFPKLNPNLKVV